MSGVQIVKITAGDDGKRLDRWLKQQLGTPQSVIFKLLRTGQVRVDGKRAKGDMRLSEGQEVRLPPVQSQEQKDRPKPLSEKDRKYIKDLVIYDDGDVVALNKPGDIATQGGTNTTYHIDGLLKGLANKDGLVPKLVHRLDKETSGVLLLARSANAVRKLGAMFKSKDMEKRYWAIVSPAPEQFDGRIKAPLLKAGGKDREKMYINEEEGQFALTDYRVIDHAASTAAFVAFRPLTGRTHQIRAHAALALGCPVIGDYKYGYNDEGLEAQVHAKRLHLHAQSLSFRHPVSNKVTNLTAPLPTDLKKTWKAFGLAEKVDGDPFAD